MRRWINGEIALGALLATFFWIGVLGWQAAYAPTEVEKQECQAAATKAGHKTEDCKSLWEKTTTDPIAFFTFVLAISTISLWLVTWRSARAQIRHSRAVERAHVFLSQPRWEWDKNNTGVVIGLRLSGFWKNSGATPALNVVGTMGVTWVPKGGSFAFGQSDAPLIEQPFVLGPGAEFAGGDLTISPNHLIANLNRGGRQFFWGVARWYDIFDTTTQHAMEFCFEVTLNGHLGMPPQVPTVTIAFSGPNNRYYDA